MSSYDFSNRVALVTGGAQGMGRAISYAFANAGASVIVADRSVEGGNETASAIVAAGGKAAFVTTDVSDAAQVEAMVASAVTTFGGLNYAVNAAGIEGESVPLAELDEALFERLHAVNVRGVFLCMKHEIRAMLSGPAGTGGAIVNIASTNSVRPQVNQSGYTASKHAVIGLTKSAAIDYAPKGIRINAIMPGSIDTPMLRNAMERRGSEESSVISRLSLLGRIGRPDEIAAAAMWLCSDESSFTVGHALAVDAGYLAR